MSTKPSLDNLARLRNLYAPGSDHWMLLQNALTELAQWRAFATTLGVAQPRPAHEGADRMAQMVAEQRGFTAWSVDLIPQLEDKGVYLIVDDDWDTRFVVWDKAYAIQEDEWDDDEDDYVTRDMTTSVFLDDEEGEVDYVCEGEETSPNAWSLKGILLINFNQASVYMQEQLKRLGCPRIPRQDQLKLR